MPIIYCYTTPEIARHNGWVKIGYSEQDAEAKARLDEFRETEELRELTVLFLVGYAISKMNVIRLLDVHQIQKNINLNKCSKTE